ncbi:MAG TPA: adenylate/guanylate cyclase domain-containing protein [Polyangiaceae bacterium]|jgi:class 3 adenylate cyclase
MGLWQRISTVGVRPDEPTGERRRVVITNQSAVIGTVSCGSFALAYAVAGARFIAPFCANVVAVALLLCALGLSKRGCRLAAKLFVLVPVNVVVVVASMLLGGRVGFLYYFFLFAAVPFLVFGGHERLARWSATMLSVVCLVFVQLFAPADARIAGVTPMIAHTIDLASAIAVLATVVFIVNLFTTDTENAEARLAEEHARSERLLLNVLPAAISARLKEDEEIADRFSEVTVLFSDIVGFTELSQRFAPDELVKMLNRIFSAFDDLAAELELEKIKTIGDCYMVAAGLPNARADHAEAMAKMALAMRDALARINREGGYRLQIRTGLHTGAVVAGVIGKRKFIYDMWGDTVNTASRMESSGVPGEIQITRDLQERLKDAFVIEPRGTISVKGKGEMETFFLKGAKTPEGR